MLRIIKTGYGGGNKGVDWKKGVEYGVKIEVETRD